MREGGGPTDVPCSVQHTYDVMTTNAEIMAIALIVDNQNKV